MITRRATLAGAAAVAGTAGTSAYAAETSGASASEIKIGNTLPYSGPASSYGAIGKAEDGFFRWVNDHGGVAGRKIDFMSLDDGYSPPKTVEQTRRLVEKEKVAFLFSSLGTPTNTAIVRYCNQNKVPQLFILTGANKWSNYREFPWTIAWPPNYRLEAQIYTKYMLKEKPDPKLAILYQNDDFGKDFPAGVRDLLGKDWDRYVVRTATYEAADPTVDSQIATLQASGANVLLVAAGPKVAAQVIRKVHDLNWKPMFFLFYGATSVGAVMRPAGAENSVGVLTTAFLKDPTDPAWDSDAGMKDFKDFMARYVPGSDISDNNYVAGYGAAYTMWKVLQQCDGDFSRANVLKQATNLKDLEVPVLLPGIKINTSPTNYRPIRSLQMARWSGKSWVRFGEIIEGVAS